MKKILCVLLVSSSVFASSWRDVARENDIVAASVLVEQGRDVNESLQDGMTPLLWATFYGSPDVVCFLLKNGASPSTLNALRYQDGYWIRNGWDALDIAMTNEPMEKYGHAPILRKDYERRMIIRLLSDDETWSERAISMLDFRDTLDAIDYNFLRQCTAISFATFPTTCNSYQLALACIENDIPGDIVECGVARGAQVAAMAYACQKKNSDKTIHLFDSFQGIPLAGPHDASQPGIRGPIKHDVTVPLEQLLVSSGVDVFSVAYVKNNMKRLGIKEELLDYHEGWFQNTLPTDADSIESICLLRLDGDLYESTKVCLEYLYPKIVSGGYIIIDDYALSGCAKAVHEYRDRHGITTPIVEIPKGRGPAYWRVD